MTIGDWVANRGADAPAELLAGVRHALGHQADLPSGGAAEALLGVAERELATWLAADSVARAGAVPLLTIDALVTLALEAAADRPEDVDAIAGTAIRRLATLAPDSKASAVPSDPFQRPSS